MGMPRSPGDIKRSFELSDDLEKEIAVIEELKKANAEKHASNGSKSDS